MPTEHWVLGTSSMREESAQAAPLSSLRVAPANQPAHAPTTHTLSRTRTHHTRHTTPAPHRTHTTHTHTRTHTFQTAVPLLHPLFFPLPQLRLCCSLLASSLWLVISLRSFCVVCLLRSCRIPRPSAVSARVPRTSPLRFSPSGPSLSPSRASNSTLAQHGG